MKFGGGEGVDKTTQQGMCSLADSSYTEGCGTYLLLRRSDMTPQLVLNGESQALVERGVLETEDRCTTCEQVVKIGRAHV